MKRFLIIIILNFLFPTMAFSKWTGPSERLSLNFGSGETEIGIIPGDVEDQFTTLFTVDKDGNILIADEYTRKALIFNKAGKHVATIRPKISLATEMSWPNSIFAISNNRLVIESGYDYQIYDYQGNLLGNINIGDNTALIAALWDGSLIIKGDKFYKYSSNGKLVQSYDTKPSELGVLQQSVPVRDDDYRFVLEYPDMTYDFTLSTRLIDSYFRDSQNKLVVSYKTERRDLVYKISRCGKALGHVQLPDDEISGYSSAGGEKYANYVARYGNATFGLDGNVYTWKKTANKYSILKWTWVDDQYSSEIAECSDEESIKRITLFFQKQNYTADRKFYNLNDVEMWKQPNGVISVVDKRLFVAALRNEIYARHGRAFQNPELKTIFETAPWYKLRSNFAVTDLNEAERKNVEFILDYEKKAGWR